MCSPRRLFWDAPPRRVKLSNDNYTFTEDLIHDAERARGQLLAQFGNKLVHAPMRFVRLGIDDFRRFRRPANS